MKILYYDCFSGISGDMNLGAMVDIGVDFEYLKEMLNKLPIKDEFHLHISRQQKMGIEGTKIDVILNTENHNHDSNHKHKEATHHHHEHTHNHVHNNNTHTHEHHEHNEIDKTHNHHHRNLESIKNIINQSSYNENIKNTSLNMFMEIAVAEAKIHGKTIDEVHFHEVGAVDSIVDIVGAAICFDYLKVDKIISSPVELGGGFVKCAHGIIPVPAPATSEILKDIPVTLGKVDSETTTPTGAAILKSNVDEFKKNINFKILKTGYGLGTKDFDIPNMVRVYLGEEVKEETKEEIRGEIRENFNKNLEIEEQFIIEANIDDMNPEIYEVVEEKLFKANALDIYKTNILMKKNRLAIKLTVLAKKEDLENIEKIIFKETTTLGIREYPVKKKMLKRDFQKVQTKYGEVTVKRGFLDNKVIKIKPEYQECKKIAKEKNIPILDIYSEISKLV